MNTALTLRGVTKRYGWPSPWVLTGANLSLEQGSLTSILGTNGSGKSTLLRIAAGVTTPSGGSASVPSKVGYVPERQAGISRFSGGEYLMHMARIRGLDADWTKYKGIELLRRLGLRPGPDIPWSHLSKGNRQKVVLAQAFLERLDAIVLDEPYSGLDTEARLTLNQLISEARAQGAAVLVSSHETPEDISQMYRIAEGHLDEETPPAQASTRGIVRRVELNHPGRVQSPDELTQRIDVVRWRQIDQGMSLILDVVPERSDDVIRAALDLGWSVRSVVPIDASGRD